MGPGGPTIFAVVDGQDAKRTARQRLVTPPAIFYELFASQADFEAHNAMPYMKDWFAKLSELAERGVKVMKIEIWRNRNDDP